MSQSLIDNIGETFAHLKSIHNYRYRETNNFVSGSRIKIEGQELINFSSNDYLGLANHPKVIEAASKALSEYGIGSTSSSLVCGYSAAHKDLEEFLADYTQRESVLLFSSGYMANMACLNSFLTNKDNLYMDKLNHASLIDAGLLSGAKLRRYPHLDMGTLKTWLENEGKQSVIATDALFSMGGDSAKLGELAKLKKQFNTTVIIDDAHGFGLYGNNGAGLLEQAGLKQEDIDIMIATFGKAVGTMGAFIAGSKDMIEYLVQKGRNYIYSTALPPVIAVATKAAIKLIQTEPERRKQLQDNIVYFKQCAKQSGVKFSESDTQIQSLVVGEPDKALFLSDELRKKKLYVKAIRPPTVPENTSRLRVSLSAAHSKEDIDQLVGTIAEIGNV